MTSKLKDTLLLVADEAGQRAELREIFQTSFNLLEAESLHQAAMLLEQNRLCIVAVLVAIEHIDEADVKRVNQAAKWGEENEIPILAVISATSHSEREDLAFSRGASDVIIKPYTYNSIKRRVQVLVDLHRHKWRLQTMVDNQSKIIRSTNQVMLDALSAIIEHRNTESGNHVLRIRRYTQLIVGSVAETFPEYKLSENTIDLISGAAALHDIGKISIPDSILNKPGKLTDEEFEIIKTHTTVGSELIHNLSGMGEPEFLRYAYNIALYHHERWDGKGYPLGLAGEDIPICAQIVGIADVLDALTTPRAYKPAFPFSQAINMILNGECGIFSPKLLECVKNLRADLESIAVRYADGLSPKNDTITIPLPGPDWKDSFHTPSQLSLVKYHTLLHYTNDTVIEIELDSGVYHVVYNPDPALDSITTNTSYNDAGDLLRDLNIHPEDRWIEASLRRLFDDDFRRGDLRRKTFSIRIFSPNIGEYKKYDLNLLRVNTGNEDQRLVIAVFHRVDPENGQNTVHQNDISENLLASPALQGLISSALRCHCDSDLTINAGANSLFLLTGYSAEEIFRQFRGRLANMVFHKDLTSFMAHIEQLRQKGGRSETEFRILRKNNAPLWVLIRSRLYIENDGNEYFYHTIQDISRLKDTEKNLKRSAEQSKLIIDKMNGILFEWDIRSDTMFCSPQWEKHFGYKPTSHNYGSQMGIATHFHPDDLPNIRAAIAELKAGRSSVSLDVRIANSEAKYLWTRIIAATHVDENGQLLQITGLLQDIDVSKREEQNLINQVGRDPLTSLLNKATAQKMINHYLANRKNDSLAAMLIVDLDNFKTVNDRYGHLYGDNVLTSVAMSLKKLFRTQDIIARFGGDEFLIFMRDIPSEDLVSNRCNLLLDAVRNCLSEIAPDLNTSCSIGGALVPIHGTGYTDLFLRADDALYTSKSKGKNTYTVYDPSENRHSALREDVSASTQIDSDKQPGMANVSFVHYVFKYLSQSEDMYKAINELLRHVGEQLQVSRVYIFENNSDNTACSNTFEWCNEGIAPEIDNLQNVSYINDIAGWPEVFNEEGVFYCADISSLAPHFRAILEPQGIKSMLQCSIRDKGEFRGYIGFDECTVNRLWTQQQIELLHFLTEVLSEFLLKQRRHDDITARVDKLQEILDNLDSARYALD